MTSVSSNTMTDVIVLGNTIIINSNSVTYYTCQSVNILVPFMLLSITAIFTFYLYKLCYFNLVHGTLRSYVCIENGAVRTSSSD